MPMRAYRPLASRRRSVNAETIFPKGCLASICTLQPQATIDCALRYAALGVRGLRGNLLWLGGFNVLVCTTVVEVLEPH